MIASLGELLESVMRNKSGMIKVKDEIKLLHSYISLQKFRYKDKFNIFFHIDERIYDFYIPNLILQPIIENSIFHGAGNRSYIEIHVYGNQFNQELLFRIKDNGCGIPKQKLESIFDDKNENNHMGLINIKRRIQLKFGEQYDVIINSEPDVGTEVTINLPVIDSIH